MGLCQGRKTALQIVITFDAAHYSDKNNVCFKKFNCYVHNAA